jgi:hypothetical protein
MGGRRTKYAPVPVEQEASHWVGDRNWDYRWSDHDEHNVGTKFDEQLAPGFRAVATTRSRARASLNLPE